MVQLSYGPAREIYLELIAEYNVLLSIVALSSQAFLFVLLFSYLIGEN